MKTALNPPLLGVAHQIGLGLLNEAVGLADGSLSWGRGAGRQREAVLDSGLYNGRCGEALLFAALYAATGENIFEEATHRALLGLVRGLPQKDYRTELARRLTLGLNGLGGVLYSLVRIDGFFPSAKLLETAVLLASVFTPGLLRKDRAFEISLGSAGALLGLLALADAGSPDALRSAEQCAAHLLAHRSLDLESGKRSWTTHPRHCIPLAGFAHGTSGIAYALLRLSSRTGAAELDEAALEAMAFERTLFRSDLGTWDSSRRQPKNRPRQESWCHGAPGIALARMIAVTDGKGGLEIAQDLRHALAATITADHPEVDSICCGYFGRIDILLEAGVRLKDASLKQEALRLAEVRLKRARMQGFLLPFNSALDAHDRPGFWQGFAGVAYTLLRLWRPDRYSCLLAMA